MSDNVALPATNVKAASRIVNYSGEAAQAQVVGLVTFTGSDDAKEVADIGSGNPLPVSAASLPLPTGAATSANQPDIRTANPSVTDRGSVVRQAPVNIWSVGFADTGSGLLAPELTQRAIGSGVTVSQSASNLVIAAGTAKNDEYLARSTRSFTGAWIQRHKTILSQRIVNNNFHVMLADIIGEELSCTINSATSITVTKTAHGFTALNIGQSMFVGAINGAAGVPGRYAIASIPSADTIEFTVAGWPASGSCTVDLFGWNYVRTLYTGTSATTMAIDSQRRGWNSGDTNASISSTASLGHYVNVAANGRNIYWGDTTVASVGGANITSRASRVENIPNEDVELYLYLWSQNGTTAPASSTSWTIGFLSVEDIVNVPVYIAGARPNGTAGPIPVSGSVTLAAATSLVGDVGVQYRANATGAAGGAHIVSAASTNATAVKASAGRVLGWSLANTTASWRYVKLHNRTTAGSAGTGVVRTIAIPPNDVNNYTIEGGIAFTTGIALTTVTGSADADATAVGAGDIVGDLFFA